MRVKIAAQQLQHRVVLCRSVATADVLLSRCSTAKRPLAAFVRNSGTSVARGCNTTPPPSTQHLGHFGRHSSDRLGLIPCLLRQGYSGGRRTNENTSAMPMKRVWWAAVAGAVLAAATTSTDETDDGGSFGGGAAVVAAAAQRRLPLPRHAVADAVENASPWVVNVVAGLSTGGGLFEADANGLRSTGSGFVISSDGLVVTNAHVVERFVDGAVVITLNSGERFQGKVQAMDRKSDLALLRCEVPGRRRLPVAEIGRSVALRAGEFVVAMGSPKGLANTCTLGIVSATARPRSELVEDAGSAMTTSDSTDFIQTDAAINSGNSGGPLIDLDGRVIGINTLKLHGTEGVGFAIPIDTAWQVITELRTRGRVDRPQLGMRLVTADPGQARGGGVMVLSVTPGGAADRAGLRFGDLITEFDGKSVAVTSEVLQRIGRKVGRSIDVTIQRDGQGGGRRHLTLVTESDGVPTPESAATAASAAAAAATGAAACSPGASDGASATDGADGIDPSGRS